jgi:protein arginine N-methyltransferase 7
MKHLLVPNPVIVPQRATVFAHIVENEHIYRFNSFNGQTIGTSGLRLARNDAALKCTGSSPALPLHIRALESETLKLTSTVPVLSFDFSKPLSCHGYVRTEKVNVRAERSGRAEAVVMWWEVHFDVEDESVIYSTEPGVQNWQDHWVQVVFPLSQREEVTKDHILELYAHHDDLRIWFDVKTSNCVFVRHEKEPCICGLHLVCNAERIYMLTDESRNTAYNDAIAEVVASLKEQSTYKDRISCLDISDGSLCALIVSSHGINSVTSIESKDVSARIFDQVSAGNRLDESIEVLCCGVKGLLPEHLKGERKVDLLVGEPFFYSMQNLPLWQAFNFWYRRSAVDHLLNPNAQIVPYRGHVCAMAVDFEHLHECFGSVGQVSGYDHAFFDSFQHEYFSRNFPFPVYMYPFARVSEVFDLAKLEFTLQAQSIMNSIKIPLDGTTRTPNAVIVWTKYDLDVNGKYVVSTGPTAPHSKQLVRFLQAPQHTSSEQLILHGHFHFDAMEGTINLNFSLE